MGEISLIKYIIYSIVLIQVSGCSNLLKNNKKNIVEEKQLGNVDSKVKSKFANNLFLYAEEIMKRNGADVALDSLLNLKEIYTGNDVPFYQTSLYNQVLMTYYSFVSDNKNSLQYEQKSYPNKYQGNEEDTGLFSFDYQAISAKQYILSHLSNERIIMLNEAHNRGQHRAFIRSLLPELKVAGFNYLAVEALAYKDTAIYSRGYPSRENGYYLSEPAFGQLIRDALKLGFNVVPYEDSSQYNPNLSSIDSRNKREINEANNILRILNSDTNAKMIVYAGHGHILKKNDDKGFKTMGERLSLLLDYDIFSIDCTKMIEGYTFMNENLHYREAISKFKMQEPFMLVKNNTPFVESTYKDKVNAEIFFPRTNYDLIYPDWLKESKINFYTLSIPNNENLKNKLLLVYKTKEWEVLKEESIPIIQFSIPEKLLDFKLYLNEGVYDVFVFENGYDILFNKQIVVK